MSLRSPIYAERPLIWTTLPYFALVAAGIRVLGGPLQRGLLEITDLRRRASVAALAATVRVGTQLFILLADSGSERPVPEWVLFLVSEGGLG